MKKRMIIIASVLIILGIVLFIIIKNNSVTKIEEPVTVHDITFFDARISKKGKKYLFTVKLDSKKDLDVKKFHAEIKDKNGKTLDVLEGLIDGIKKDDSLVIKIESSKNLKKAYQISYTIYKE